MALKPSLALVAAMMAITAPAFAQDSTPSDTETPAETLPGTTGTLPPAADAPGQTDAATEAPTDAGTAVTETETETGDATAGDTDASDSAPESTQDPTGSDTADQPAPAAGGAEAPAGDATAPAADAAASSDAAPSDAESAGTGTQDANAEPQVGEYYVRSTHDDWLIRCIRAAEGVDPCELYQLMRDESGNSVAEVTMIPLEGGEVAAGATVVVPLETDLNFGLNFQIDQGRGRVYPFNFCAPVGCVARVGFPDADLNALRRGNVANVALLPFGGDPESPVQLQLSLTGFTAGLEALQELAVNEPADGSAAGDPATASGSEADAPSADATTEEPAPAN